MAGMLTAMPVLAATGGLAAYEGDQRIGGAMYVNAQLPETLGAGTNATAVGIITNNGYLVETELEPYRIVRARPSIYYFSPGFTGAA